MLIMGCYNNSHVRPQRVIEPGERIVSVGSNLSVGGPGDHDSYRIDDHGVSGLRVGLSYLTNINNTEHGIYLGLGSLSISSSYILGYDFRKVVEKDGRQYRYSLYSEFNGIYRSEEAYWDDNIWGSAFQFRPAISTVTSASSKYYGGIHGILGFGMIQKSFWEDYYNTQTSELSVSFNTTTAGVGVTAGHEQRLFGLIVQTQFDVSLLSHSNSLIEGNIDRDYYNGFDPMNETAVHFGLGMACYLAPKKKPGTTRVNRKVSHQYVSAKKTETELRYDPFTGKLVKNKHEKPLLQFDPVTGEPMKKDESQIFDPVTGDLIPQEKPLQFDPLTGLPLEKKGPTRSPEASLLNPQEQTALVVKGLRILALNGLEVNAKVMDLNGQGIVINYKGVGNQPRETLYYQRIHSITFGTPSNGLGKAGSIALAGCAVGIGIPLSIALVADEFELLGIGILTAPLGGVGGLLYGLTHRDLYQLNFVPFEKLKLTPGDLNDKKKHAILSMTKQYLDSGFPSYNLVE